MLEVEERIPEGKGRSWGAGIRGKPQRKSPFSSSKLLPVLPGSQPLITEV